MYDIKDVRGHVEVYRDGEFVFSADSRAEAEEDISELEKKGRSRYD